MESYISPPEGAYLPMLEAEREIKGVQLLSVTDGRIEQSTASRNQEVYWKRDYSTVVIGREPQSGTTRRLAPNSFVLPCPVMSREHAIVHMEGNQVFLTDSASHHGTWRHVFGMNSKVEDKLPVLDGDIFIFGKPVEKNGQVHQPATVTVKFAYSDPSSNLPARRPTVDPDDRFDSYHYTKSNRYGLDDDDLDDDDDDEGFEYDRESDHASSFEDHITYDAPIHIDDEFPPRRFSSPFYSYQSHSPQDRALSRSPSVVEIPSVKYQRDSLSPGPRDRAISRSPSIVEIPSLHYQYDLPGPAMGDIHVSPEPTHLSPNPHSPSSNVPASDHSLPPYGTNPPYFNPSPLSSSVHEDGTFPSETQNIHVSFPSSPPPPELPSARNSFASEPHSDPNFNSDSYPQVVAAPPEFRAEIFERLQKLKGLQADIDLLKTFRKDVTPIDLNEQIDAGGSTSSREVLENDQRLAALESKLARVLLEVESGLGSRYVALETIDIQCNELLQEVADLRAEVAGGREEVDSILTEVKKLAVDTEAAIKAHLEQVQRAKEADEASVSISKASRKRSLEDDVGGDVTTNTEAANDNIILDAEENQSIQIDGGSQAAAIATIHASSPSSSGQLDSSTIEQRPVKRMRIEIGIPSPAGVLAGAVAGSLLTWAGLAYY